MANGRSKLTEEEVNEIRNRYIPRCFMNGAKPLATEFNVKREQIYRIVSGRRWGYLLPKDYSRDERNPKYKNHTG